jgi:phosphonate transport system substrate-binding protein
MGRGIMRRLSLFAWWVLIGAIVLGLAGCAPEPARGEKYIDFRKVESLPVASAVNTDAQVLRVAISSVLLPQETVVHYRTIANYLGEQLGRPVILIQRKSYAEIALLLLNGGADIAFFSTGEYANYSGFGEIEMLAGQQRMGSPYTQGYLLVSKDSGINHLADLRGKSVAFTDPLSYSGYTFLVYMLGQQNETPEKFFGRYIYTYSHDKSFRAVVNKVVDAAPVTRFVYDRAKIKSPDLAEAVKIIAVSPTSAPGPVVAGKTVNASQREVLRRALLTLHENPSTLTALQGLMIDKFVAPQPELYEPIRRMVHAKREKP